MSWEPWEAAPVPCTSAAQERGGTSLMSFVGTTLERTKIRSFRGFGSCHFYLEAIRLCHKVAWVISAT